MSTSLRRCDVLYGNATVIGTDPQFELHHDLIYFPHVWGLYDQGNKLVTGTGFFRRNEQLELIGSDFIREFDSADVTDYASESCYYFMGHIPAHYGHFLLSTLSRLWAYASKAGRGMKVITYGDLSKGIPAFVAEILSVFGIGIDDLVTFDAPTRLPRVMVASPSFEETNFAHRAYVAVCRDVGDALVSNLLPEPSDTPIYLAKYRLPSGVWRLANEEEFCAHLERRGIQIVFPEQLSVSRQIRLWSDRRRVAGLVGSAFHTASFVPPSQLLVLNYDAGLLSNQVLIDRAAQHDSVYVYSVHGADYVAKEHVGSFGALRTLRYPAKVADDFLRILDPFMGIKPLDLRGMSLASETTAAGPLPNLALRRPARQSSVSAHSLKRSGAQDAGGAVSGFLTGGYQFCTKCEDNPWWEVDLGLGAVIGEIRIFNRRDSAAERAARFVLAVSDDGVTWTDIYRREEWPPFGGIDGRPFVWRSERPLAARFVRFTLLGRDVLHLDQVAVFGPGALHSEQRQGSSRLAAFGLKTQWGTVVCVDEDGQLVGRSPSDARSSGAVARFEVSADQGECFYVQGSSGRQIRRAVPVHSGVLAGIVLHLLADPWTAALSRNGRYYCSPPDESRLVADRLGIGGWEMFALMTEEELADLTH